MSLTRQYTDLYPDLIPYLRGCPEPIVLSAIRRMTRKFCSRSEAWRVELDPITLREGITEYEIDAPFDAEIRRISELRINTEDGVDAGIPGTLIPDDKYLYDRYDDSKVVLDDAYEPTEDVTNGLEIKVVLVPKRDADRIDVFFLDMWQDVIIGGVMSDLMVMPNVKWSDPARALIGNQEYLRGISMARAELDRQSTNRTLSISA